MTADDFRNILKGVTYPGYTYHVREFLNHCYLQIEFDAPDCKTGEAAIWKSRKWVLSQHMTRSEVVQTALAATLMAVEHEARERFKYHGRAIFGPHFDVDFLHAMCNDQRAEDVRPNH